MSKFFNIESNKKNKSNNNNNKFINNVPQDYETQNGNPNGYNNQMNMNNMATPMGMENVNYNQTNMNNNQNYGNQAIMGPSINQPNVMNQVVNNQPEVMVQTENQPVEALNLNIEDNQMGSEQLEELQVEETLETEVLEDENLEKEEQALDPLNNATNPVPVNPVAPVSQEQEEEEELSRDVKTNILTVIGIMLKMFVAPGTTIVTNSKKYRSFMKAFIVTIWITVVTLLLCVATRVVVGAFAKTYNAITGTYSINFSFNNVLSLDNYLQYLVIALLVSFVGILILAFIYYGFSFFNSKGVQLGSYIMVSNLGMLPLIVGVVVIYPILSIISTYLGLLALIFTFLCSIVTFLTGVNNILTFKNNNSQILYNVINLSCVILLMIIICVLLIRVDILSLPELII